MKKIIFAICLVASISGFAKKRDTATLLTDKSIENVNFEDIIFEGDINIVGLSVEEIGVGGLVGRVEGSSILALKISKDSDIEDDDENKLKSNIPLYGTFSRKDSSVQISHPISLNRSL